MHQHPHLCSKTLYKAWGHQHSVALNVKCAIKQFSPAHAQLTHESKGKTGVAHNLGAVLRNLHWHEGFSISFSLALPTDMRYKGPSVPWSLQGLFQPMKMNGCYHRLHLKTWHSALASLKQLPCRTTTEMSNNGSSANQIGFWCSNSGL